MEIKKMKNNKGFTLIELLVVVLIIGILAAIALPQYFKAVERSRAAEANSVLGAVSHAQAVYHMAHADATTAYTTAFADLDTEFPGTVSGATLTTDLFTYNLGNAVSESTAQICASRRDGLDYKLGLTYYTGTRCCKDGTGNGANICASMGMTSENTCCSAS